jgi:hypothetical protein
MGLRCIFTSLSPRNNLDQLTDSHQTWFGRHVIGDHPTFVLFLFPCHYGHIANVWGESDTSATGIGYSFVHYVFVVNLTIMSVTLTCVASSARVKSEWLIGKVARGSGRGRIWGTAPVFARKEWGKPHSWRPERGVNLAPAADKPEELLNDSAHLVICSIRRSKNILSKVGVCIDLKTERWRQW